VPDSEDHILNTAEFGRKSQSLGKYWYSVTLLDYEGDREDASGRMKNGKH
jgi:hypothetical protein